MLHSSKCFNTLRIVFNQHRDPPTYTLLLACILTKSFQSAFRCLFYLPALSTSTVLGTLSFEISTILFISTISLFRINLFLSLTFDLDPGQFTFFHLGIQNDFDQ